MCTSLLNVWPFCVSVCRTNITLMHFSERVITLNPLIVTADTEDHFSFFCVHISRVSIVYSLPAEHNYVWIDFFIFWKLSCKRNNEKIIFCVINSCTLQFSIVFLHNFWNCSWCLYDCWFFFCICSAGWFIVFAC